MNLDSAMNHPILFHIPVVYNGTIPYIYNGTIPYIYNGTIPKFPNNFGCILDQTSRPKHTFEEKNKLKFKQFAI